MNHGLMDYILGLHEEVDSIPYSEIYWKRLDAVEDLFNACHRTRNREDRRLFEDDILYEEFSSIRHRVEAEKTAHEMKIHRLVIRVMVILEREDFLDEEAKKHPQD